MTTSPGLRRPSTRPPLTRFFVPRHAPIGPPHASPAAADRRHRHEILTAEGVAPTPPRPHIRASPRLRSTMPDGSVRTLEVASKYIEDGVRGPWGLNRLLVICSKFRNWHCLHARAINLYNTRVTFKSTVCVACRYCNSGIITLLRGRGRRGTGSGVLRHGGLEP